MKSPVTRTMRVQRLANRTNFHSIQILYRDTKVFGFCIWSAEVDREVVPTWASIEVACCGSTTWESKFSEHIP